MSIVGVYKISLLLYIFNLLEENVQISSYMTDVLKNDVFSLKTFRPDLIYLSFLYSGFFFFFINYRNFCIIRQ